ncbi:MAG: fibronectin type III domain-containing protein [Thermodesulfobacteriota bacterium]
MTIDYIIDPATCGGHHKTRWQISRNPGFNGLTYNKNTIRSDAFSHQVAPGVLQPNTTYYWRARVWCDSGCKSYYSETFSFTTGAAPNDANNNGIPDDQEIGEETDLDGNGQPDGQGDNFSGVNTVVNNMYVAIETSENITFLQSLNNQDQSILDGMPANMPWGLINFRVETTNPGDTVQITIYFDEKAPNGSVLYKYDPVEGWIDYSEHAAFAPNMKSVIIEIQDGGFGDLDGVANGVIVDPCGIGTNSKGGGGGGGSCFLDTISENP